MESKLPKAVNKVVGVRFVAGCDPLSSIETDLPGRPIVFGSLTAMLLLLRDLLDDDSAFQEKFIRGEKLDYILAWVLECDAAKNEVQLNYNSRVLEFYLAFGSEDRFLLFFGINHLQLEWHDPPAVSHGDIHCQLGCIAGNSCAVTELKHPRIVRFPVPGSRQIASQMTIASG